jgi:hypothetical protein
MTTEKESAARRPPIQPRAFAEIQAVKDAERARKRAAEQAAFDALTPAEQTKLLLQEKADADAKAARQAEFDAGLHEHVMRVCAAVKELLELAKAESAAAGAEVEVKLAQEQVALAAKQQRETLAFLLSLLSNLPDDAFADEEDDDLEPDCFD